MRIISSSKGILVVEDDLDIFEIIRIYLNSEGFNVFHSLDSSQALEHLNNEDIHLVLLDLQLPKTCGFDICKLIRETFEVPIIFLSGKTECDIVMKGLELGANDYMFKPFIPNELVAKVRSFI